MLVLTRKEGEAIHITWPISSPTVLSHVREITTDPDDATIVEAIILMAKSMRMQVVAEGVETEEQKNFLLERGCNVVQGFLFSPPDPADKIPSLINS